MRSLTGAAILILAVAMAAGLALAADDNSGGGPPPRQQDGNGPGGGGPGAGPGGQRGGPPAGFHLIPRFAMEKLDLTDDQKKQIDALEKETKDKLGKILSAEQMKTVEEARPPRRGQGGGPGGGGPDGGGQGGRPQGGPDRQPGGDNADRPPRPQN